MIEPPPLTEGACHVWWATPSVAARPALVDLLDAPERERHQRFRRAEDRDRYLAAHALTRLVLAARLGAGPADLRFTAVCKHCGGPHGKPYVNGARELEFSVTHSGDRVGVALALGVPVGLDVERVAGHRDGLARAILADGESLGADHDRDLIRYWTRKEAAIKATADGLAVAPGKVHVSAPAEPAAVVSWPGGPERIALLDLAPGDSHLGCLAMLGPPLDVTEHDGTALLTSAIDSPH